MKILHVIGVFDKKNGGTYSAITGIMSIETKIGHTSEIISTTSEDQEYDKDLFNGRIHLFNKSFPKRFIFSKHGSNWLNVNIKSYDLVHIHELWSGLATNGAVIAKKMGVKYAIWPHGSLDPFDLRKKKFLKQILGRVIIGPILQNADAICCTSELEKNLLETYGKKPKIITILPLAIDYDQQGDNERFRRKYYINKETFVFLFISRIDYKKGLDLFLLALGKYLIKNPDTDLKLVIAGSGTKNYNDKIDNLILNQALSNYSIKVGFLSGQEKADAFAASDCFVLTSMNENYGISTIEALQAGLPVLISNNIYIWEKIIPEGGWVCNYSVSSIENSLKQIMSKQEHLKKEPKNVGEQFSTKSLITCYKKFYDSLDLHLQDYEKNT